MTNNLLNWAKHDLEHNLLKWWTNHATDNENGGYYGIISSDNTPDKTAKRFLVLIARLLWTFSASYEVTGNEDYKTQAKRAYDYLTSRFHDNIHGGFYTYVDHKGNVDTDYKFTYGNAFAVYGLSEYARVFGCEAAKALAKDTVIHIDNHLWDPDHKGYFETASRQWHYMPNVLMLHGDTSAQKTMNTHLHVLEAYANLLKIDDSKPLRSRVRELLYLFRNKIINQDNWHFNYFQTRDWTPTTPELSLGHDIEGSWLLYECAEILGEPETMADIRHISINIARAVYDDGIAENGAIPTTYDPQTKTFTEKFSWWEQCEGVVGFLNAYQLTNEEKFLNAAASCLEIINNHFIDHEYGGWYAYVDQKGQPIKTAKCSPFTCPYHNARMSIEIIKRLED